MSYWYAILIFIVFVFWCLPGITQVKEKSVEEVTKRIKAVIEAGDITKEEGKARQQTGAGGSKTTFLLEGQLDMEGKNDTITYNVSPDKWNNRVFSANLGGSTRGESKYEQLEIYSGIFYFDRNLYFVRSNYQ